MTLKNWILTDCAEDAYVDSLSLSGDDLFPEAKGCSITKRTLRGSLRDGVEVVEIDNGLFRFAVLPTRAWGFGKAGWVILSLAGNRR